MKKRLRKKRRIGEYSHYGYSFECEWTNQSHDLTPIEDNDPSIIFWDKLVEWHESRGFTCGGGSNGQTIGWILDKWKSDNQKQHNSPTDNDRDELVEWLKNQGEIKSIKVTDRIHLWKFVSEEECDRQLENWKIEWNL